MKNNPRVVYLSSESDAAAELGRIGVDPYGIQAMVPKMVHLNILLEGLECRVANIIKQEMLSVGGDAAVARGSVGCSVEKTDVLLIGTRKQIDRFTEKLSRQPFGLAETAAGIRQCLAGFSRRPSVLKTSRRELKLDGRPLIMGILNVTSDSFSDGGRFIETGRAVEQALRMEGEGADIIDIGGESTRPGSEGVSLEVEMERVLPVLKAISGRLGIPVSLDTTKPELVRRGADLGAEILNDVTALAGDEMAEAAAETGMAVILMHMRGTPRTMQSGSLEYASLRGEIVSFLRSRLQFAVSRGIEPEKVAVDPGIGFGKGLEDNLRLLKYLPEFKVIGRPVLVGPSRKGFIGKITGQEEAGERLAGTAAAAAIAVLNGADIVRVHDIKEMRQVCDMAGAIARVSSL